jgi:hypothetical protein
VTDKTRIVERIIKLFRLGNVNVTGTHHVESNTTEAEMMAAVTKARQLMTEHNISFSDIHHVTDKASADKIKFDIGSHTAYTRKIRDLADYDRWIATAVERMFDVKSLYYPGKHHSNHGYSSIRFAGEPTDAAIAIEVFHIILTHVRRMARNRFGGGNYWGRQHTSYAVGFAQRLWQRADEAAKAKQPECVALVLASKAAAIEKWYQTHITRIPEEELGKERERTYDDDARALGYIEGGEYNLNFDKAVKGRAS